MANANEINTVDNAAVIREAPQKITKFDLFLAPFMFLNGVVMTLSNTKKAGTSFAASMGWILRKLYRSKEDLAEALVRHSEFYLTDYVFGGSIFGLVISMEEQRAHDLYEKGTSDITPDLIRALKAGLMGPMAGFGDTILQTVIWVLTIAYAFPLALEGNWLAIPISWFGIGGIRYVISIITTFAGYYSGRDAVTKMTTSAVTQKVLTVAAIVAMCVMGALTAGNVKFAFSSAIVIGEQSLNTLLDTLVPGILNIAPVFIVYYLFKVKKVHIAKIMVGIIVICVALGMLGLFG